MKKANNDYLENLNPEQRAAVTQAAAHRAVVAGPGTGKTQTLIARIVYLIRKLHTNPSSIMVVTFTRKAAAQLKSKLKQYLSPDEYPGYIGTFHALAFSILQNHYGKMLTVITPEEQAELVPSKQMRERISAYKNNILAADSELKQIVNQYNTKLLSKHRVDYDDLLLMLQDALITHSKKQPRITHVLIDEFQDTNGLQYDIIRNLGAQEYFVIGDPKQSIYSFRGALPEIFERFTHDFPQTKVFSLSRNYRSGSRILSVAQSLFPDSAPLISVVAHEAMAQCITVSDEYTEASCIVRTIIENTGGVDLHSSSRNNTSKQESFSDCAVIYRTHAFARTLESVFIQSGIPYQVIGGESLYESPLVRFITNCLRALVSPESTILPLPSSLANRLPLPQECVAIIQDNKESGLADKPVTNVFNTLVDQFELERRFSKQKTWLSYLQQCISTIVQFDSSKQSVQSYLDYIDYLEDHEFYDPHNNAVTLMTIHAAKGLEFSHVFICGMEEGSIPSHTKGADGDEERRLLYVAITRAKQAVYLLKARQRQGKNRLPSPLLSELSSEHLEYAEDKVSIRKVARKNQLKMF
ncbi:MAG: ATP-dependent helicase [Candidatus Roizmanbacteria bacterium]|nr:ATP-dependent helicase [Candidatus Roizmanbacteria bacterium]